MSDNLEEAVGKAIAYCIEHNVLKDVLENRAAEITELLVAEWTANETRDVLSEEEHKNGVQHAIALLSQGQSIEKLKQCVEKIYSSLSPIDDFLTAKWNWEDAKKVWFAEGMEEVLELLKEGLSLGEIQERLSLGKNHTIESKI
ncbi:MAG: hypothetical protein LBV20_07340 [Treponema sp.]|jgi:DNA-binding NarL/FixJ family response regulator|nr:hypothetical protein [Treponema sp.]